MTEQKSQKKAKPARRWRWRPSRRGFLIGTGILAGGLALGVPIGLPILRREVAGFFDSGALPSNYPTDPALWFTVTADNRVRLILPKMEMGQGIHTALGQIAADELSIAWEQLEVMAAGTNEGPVDAFGTFGSTSVASSWEPLRQAAATLREMLRAEGATQLGVAPMAVTVAEGMVFVTAESARRRTFGDIIVDADAERWQTPEEPAPLLSDNALRFVGRSLPRVDIPLKVTGQADYGYDMRVPGMRYGAVLKPIQLAATLDSVDTSEAARSPGVQQIVVDGDFVGVVADTRWHAWQARNRIDAHWKAPRLWTQAQIDETVSVGGRGGITIQVEGDGSSPLRSGDVFSAEYRTPCAFHATLEPQAALADVRTDSATIWTSTQGPHVIRGAIAAALELKPEQVEVIPTYLGAGLGCKIDSKAAIEAARLSQAVGAPVHVGWNRAEEMRNGYLRPPTHHRLRARLDDAGRIEVMEHLQASGQVAFGFIPDVMAAVLGADFGAWRGAMIQYAIPHRHVRTWVRTLPLDTGWWRGLGLLANTFALESFMDEMAAVAGADPLAFRLDHLPSGDKGRRFRAVLEAVAEQANWRGILPSGHAQGIAVSEDVDTIVAQVAEVSMNEGGQLRVHRVDAVMDCGRVINPDGAVAQVQGAVMLGVGSALLEEAQVADGKLVSANFDRYPLLTLADAPYVEVGLLEAGDGKPRGVGEPPIGPVAAAIANGLATATGKRVRQMPFTPERVT